MKKDLDKVQAIELQEEKGASMLEYALLAALIAVVAIAAISFLGKEASEAFKNVADHMDTSVT
jgi:pilus assembly protein Flp/PilA